MTNITAEQNQKDLVKGTVNKYRVPKKLWDSFKSEQAKKTYNEVYFKALKNQSILVHPKALWIEANHWKTICHNFACLAAWAVTGSNILDKNTVVKDVTPKGKVVKKRTVK